MVIAARRLLVHPGFADWMFDVGAERVRDMQPDGDVHDPSDPISQRLNLAKRRGESQSGQREPRRELFGSNT
jgi:hypothetical protein